MDELKYDDLFKNAESSFDVDLIFVRYIGDLHNNKNEEELQLFKEAHRRAMKKARKREADASEAAAKMGLALFTQ